MAEFNTLLYLIYGNSEEYHVELTYSVMSALRFGADDIRIVLVSDRATRRDDLPIEHLAFTEAEFKKWSLNGRYSHAVKIGCLLKAIDHFGGKIAFIDTDTYFLRPPNELFQRISPNSAVMHVREGTLDEQLGYYDTIIDHARQHPIGGYEIDGASSMFNSGVVGVHKELRDAITDALSLVHELHTVAPGVHTLEQFAIGTALATRVPISEANDLIYHYYGYSKHFIHCQLREIITEFSMAQFEKNMRPLRSLIDFPKKRPLDLILSKLKRRRRRQQEIYAFAYLAYLSAFSVRRMDYANAWASVAIDAIRWNDFPRDIVEADFRRMTPRFLPGYKWMKPATRELWDRYWCTT